MSAVLQLDVDHGRPVAFGEVTARLARAGYRPVWVIRKRSPSGRGWHLWMRIQPAPLSLVELVGLQLLCGSDPRREAYNLNRARRVDRGETSGFFAKRWNVFYAKRA